MRASVLQIAALDGPARLGYVGGLMIAPIWGSFIERHPSGRGRQDDRALAGWTVCCLISVFLLMDNKVHGLLSDLLTRRRI